MNQKEYFNKKNQIKDVSRVSTPDSVYEEKIFDQFREKLNNSFHFKNVEMETELPYVRLVSF